MAVTVAQMNDGLATTLGTISGITTTHTYDELLSGMARGNLPLLQVYWDEFGPLSEDSRTDRTSFQGVVRHKIFRFLCDLYVSPVSHLGENMATMVDLLDEFIDKFEEQDTPPYFGVTGVKAWQLETVNRVVFDYGGGSTPARYLGIRFPVVMHVY